MAKKKSRKISKAAKQVVDVKKAAAHDVETPEVKLPAKNASAVAKGAAYHVLAGRPSKPSVVSTFGKSGYALSWVARAEKLGIEPDQLCERFKTDPAAVKAEWEKLGIKK